MPRFWWVNHKATLRQEIAGGYLWSPKREKNARSQFYENMRLVRPGDLVLSYANGRVSDVGAATDISMDSARPIEFGDTGQAWSTNGWIVPVAWSPLLTPVRPMDIWERLRPLLPTRYSPLVLATGRGSQKAYLSEIDERAFDLVMTTAGASRPETDLPSTLDALREKFESELERAFVAFSETERAQLILARRGQGIFRQNVARIEKCCRLTGTDFPDLLVASHIKPWRVCASGEERLDGNNGLLLTPNADRLFDRGFLTFDDIGEPTFSAFVSLQLLSALGLGEKNRREPQAFSAAQKLYLAYHRENIFRSGLEDIPENLRQLTAPG